MGGGNDSLSLLLGSYPWWSAHMSAVAQSPPPATNLADMFVSLCPYGEEFVGCVNRSLHFRILGEDLNQILF
jgi:hypothetical protein